MTASPGFDPPLAWLEPGDPFPPVDRAWGPHTAAPGLLAAGSDLSVPTLVSAYRLGIFPWYSAGQPILWWSTDPRMVLRPEAFRLHRSLRKDIAHLLDDNRLDIRFNHDFGRVIRACAHAPRAGQSGTWIVPAMVGAYERLHAAGHAHSVEAWIDGDLAGGLYCVNVGAMVFGESMFSHRSNASKIALASLIAFCRAEHLPLIDCQQDTPHLASLGASLMLRARFREHLAQTTSFPMPRWHFAPVYWSHLFQTAPPRDATE